MPYVLRSVWRRLGRLPWTTPLAVVTFVFVSSWALMALAEPGALTEPGNFWWYFLVTSSTVGYGDLFPTTTPGRLVAGYIIFGGITALTMIFARVATALENARSRRMQGQITHRFRDHVVVIGYHPGRTEKIIHELSQGMDQPVVLCAWEEQAAQHPMPGAAQVHFVRGNLTDEDVLDRANIEAAHAVLVDARDDNEAVAVTIAAERAATGVHTVVALRDLERRRTIHKVDATAHCVQWHSVAMLVEELHDPGIGLVYQQISSAGGDVATYSSQLPAKSPARSYGEWQTVLGKAHGATVLAISTGEGVLVSPPWSTPVPPGATLFYVCSQRLTEEALSMAASSYA
jgi:voltage-gated potassium channel